MAEIKRILKLAEDEPNLSERSMGKIIGCSKNTIKAIKEIASRINVTYEAVKDLNEEEIHSLFYPNNNPFQNIPEPNIEYCIKELKKKHVTVLLLWNEYIEKYPNGLRYTQFKKETRVSTLRLPVHLNVIAA